MSSLIGNRGPTGGRNNNQTGNIIPKGYGHARLDQYTPEQHQLLSDMMQHANPNSFLSQIAGGNENAFSQMEAPAHRQFQGQIGELGSRFSGLGMGARKGSGFNIAAGQATNDFASQLQSNRLGLMRQAQQDLFGLSDQLLNKRPYENSLVDKPQNWLEKLFAGLGGAAIGGGGGYIASGGNPLMALAGGLMGAGSAYKGASY